MNKIRVRLQKNQIVVGIEKLQDSTFTNPPLITIFPKSMGEYECLLEYNFPTAIDESLRQYITERINQYFRVTETRWDAPFSV